MNKEKWNLYYFALIHGIIFSLAIGGCATQSKSIGLGGGIGAGAGAILGGIADPGKDGAKEWEKAYSIIMRDYIIRKEEHNAKETH